MSLNHIMFDEQADVAADSDEMGSKNEVQASTENDRHDHNAEGKLAPVSLLDMPPEIQNRIFELATVSADIIDLRTVVVERLSTGRLVYSCRNIYYEPPLTAVNQAIRRAVLSIYYGHNTFSLRASDMQNLLTNGMRPVEAWLQHVGDNCRFLRRVCITTFYNVSRECMTLAYWVKLHIGIDGEGAMVFRREVYAANEYRRSCYQELCVCDLQHLRLATSAGVSNGDRIRRLAVEAEKDHTATAVYRRCDTCKLGKLCNISRFSIIERIQEEDGNILSWALERL
ncbi:hypothetical protein LTR37_001083 [Vermiconidia calcicola]|uniref:Uncharacterized protein n=1 Tax=Vermiconidia calcicola TaxID=1690605 RepID=A0ACC3NX46_9PEZI|nr:hypothetical protein LTR37_001083 [Vermiconidia calcicola]